MRIGVFDSGVGGLSILESIERRLPQASFYYCCDSLNFPYGTKTDAEVIAYTTSACAAFVRAADLDLLVVGCNTASTVSLPSVRQNVSCPVIGVVPAVKPAASQSLTKCIGVLATKGAVKSAYLNDLVTQFAHGCEVRLCGSSELVDMAERKIRGEAVDLELLKSEIAALFKENELGQRKIDTVVLGCTHFPLLRFELAQAAPWSVEWVDSGDAIAARTVQLLTEARVTPQAERVSIGGGFATGPIAALWPHGVPAFVKRLGLTHWQTLAKVIEAT